MTKRNVSRVSRAARRTAPAPASLGPVKTPYDRMSLAADRLNDVGNELESLRLNAADPDVRAALLAVVGAIGSAHALVFAAMTNLEATGEGPS